MNTTYPSDLSDAESVFGNVRVLVYAEPESGEIAKTRVARGSWRGSVRRQSAVGKSRHAHAFPAGCPPELYLLPTRHSPYGVCNVANVSPPQPETAPPAGAPSRP